MPLRERAAASARAAAPARCVGSGAYSVQLVVVLHQRHLEECATALQHRKLSLPSRAEPLQRCERFSTAEKTPAP
jgi:hypothetical protein